MTDQKLRETVEALPTREEGQTMAEYGVVLSVITVACVAVFAALAGGVEGAITRVIAVF